MTPFLARELSDHPIKVGGLAKNHRVQSAIRAKDSVQDEFMAIAQSERLKLERKSERRNSR